MLDRGYTDFKRLHTFTKASAFFIIPAKKKLDFGRRSYRKVDKSTGLRSDVTIGLQGVKTSVDYPEGLRRISYFDIKRDKRLIFLSNNFLLSALTITELYKCRWQVELFFKWIKQHLRIKVFFGHSPNAVKTQIWIAISTYLMMAILKKELKLERPMHEISQILSIALFEKSPLFSLFQPLKQKNLKSD
jgi:IS4 transposase